jgi:hypothetical protein|nr:MAG TPA: hypothetical protein [Caudoviricetes sp.]
MKTNVSKANVKKEAINVLTNEMLSPFAVLNAINKNRKDPAIMELLNMYGITKKLELSDLCGLYDYSERNVFCKLRKITDKNNIEFCEYKQVKIGNAFYEYIPIRFTIRDFFYSLESSLKLKKETERIEQMYADLFNKEDNKAEKAKEKAANKAEKRAKQIAEKAKELRDKYKDVPENILLQLAEEFFKAA